MTPLRSAQVLYVRGKLLVLTFLFWMELCHGWVTAGKSGNSCAGWKTSILQLDNASMASVTIKSAHNAPSLTSQPPWLKQKYPLQPMFKQLWCAVDAAIFDQQGASLSNVHESKR